MLNFDDLRLKINPLYEGEELVKKLLILPEVDSKALSKGEKLFKLLELYKIFIPNKKIEVIYNNLYLSLVASLERKGTLDEVRLLNSIYKYDSPNKRFGVAGGLDSFKILGRSGTGLFAISIHPITFYSSSSVLDMLTQFILLANIILIHRFNQPCKERQ